MRGDGAGDNNKLDCTTGKYGRLPLECDAWQRLVRSAKNRVCF
jgi:hypothetical protein